MRFSPVVPKLSLFGFTSCPLTASFLLQVRKRSQDSEDPCLSSCIKIVAELSLEPKSQTPSAAHPRACGAEGRNTLRVENRGEGSALCFWLCPGLSHPC